MFEVGTKFETRECGEAAMFDRFFTHSLEKSERVAVGRRLDCLLCSYSCSLTKKLETKNWPDRGCLVAAPVALVGCLLFPVPAPVAVAGAQRPTASKNSPGITFLARSGGSPASLFASASLQAPEEAQNATQTLCSRKGAGLDTRPETHASGVQARPLRDGSGPFEASRDGRISSLDLFPCRTCRTGEIAAQLGSWRKILSQSLGRDNRDLSHICNHMLRNMPDEKLDFSALTGSLE